MEREKLIGLVTRAQSGDAEALNTLFENFYNDVYYFAYKTLKDEDTACDITQETFLEIMATISDLKEPAAFVTWMKQITYHQCTRYFKKKKEVLVEEDEEGNTVFDTLADENENSIPAEIYEREDFRNTILGIINELTEEQRSAVMMYYFDELTVGQIAQIQGVSDGTVKSRLNYARKALKKSVENYEKKYDIKLHSVSLLPLLLLFFARKAMPEEKAAAVRQQIRKASGGASASASHSASGTAAKVVGCAKFGAKGVAMPLTVKVIAGVLTAAVLIGGGVAAAIGIVRSRGKEDMIPEPSEQITEPEQEVDPHLDEDRDGYCDHCGAAMCGLDLAEHRIENCFCTLCGTGSHTEGENHPFCGVCLARLPIDDRDGDGACDVCGEYSCGGPYHGNANHIDDDNDGICDICQKYMCGLVWGLEHYMDYSDGIYDGKCDHCGGSSYPIGWDDDGLPHGDSDGDGKCECCGRNMCGIYGTEFFGGVDADEDGKCDVCQWHLCINHSGNFYHYDFDRDEKCDRCERYLCAFEFLPHADENGDRICDRCFSGIYE